MQMWSIEARVRFCTVFVRVRKRYFRLQGTVLYGFVRLDLFWGGTQSGSIFGAKFKAGPTHHNSAYRLLNSSSRRCRILLYNI